MRSQEKAMSEATFVPPLEPPVDVGKVALALIVLVGVIGLALSLSESKIIK